MTFGATEAIAAALLGLCDPGDEVIALDPTYDSYAAGVALAGARLRRVPLRPPAWRFDAAELEAAVTERTRLVLLNSPHNPTGRVLDRAELEAVAAVCREHDLIARDRRGLRAPRLRRRARAAGHAAGDGRAHADGLVDREDVLA